MAVLVEESSRICRLYIPAGELLCRGFQRTKEDKLRIFQTQDQATDQKEGTRCNILGYSFCS